MSQHLLPSIEPEKGEWAEDALSRRRFLQLGVWATTGASAVTLGGSITRFLVANSLADDDQNWVELGPVADFPPGQVHKINYSFRTKDAWRDLPRSSTLYAFSDDGAAYTALDATCTHLGCLVRWQVENGRFACPCHEGIFSQTGEVLGGAPTKPLRQLTTKVENGILYALV